MSLPDKLPSPGLEVYAYASALLDKGLTEGEITAKLIEKGLDLADAVTVTQGVLSYRQNEKLQERAAALLRAGLQPVQIRDQLCEEGFPPRKVSEVFHELVERRRARKANEAEGPPISGWLGGTVFLLGLALGVGHNTGLFRTVPYAAWPLMCLGVLIFWIGRGLSGED